MSFVRGLCSRIAVRVAQWVRGCALVGLAAFGPIAWADSVNSPNITLNVDANRSAGPGAGNVSVVVNTITIAETMLPEYSSGAGKTVTIQARPGFQFDPASAVTIRSATIGFNGGGIDGVASITPTGAANETLAFTLTSGTNATAQDIIRVNGVRVRILSAAGAAGPALTTLALTTSAAGGAFSNQGIVAATISRGAADHLEFANQPGSTGAGDDLLPSVKIADFGGNQVQNDVRTIVLNVQANPGSAALQGTILHDTVNGLASWVAADDLRIATAGAGYTLRATHGGAAFLSSDSVDSAPFDIVAGAPDHLEVTRQPANTAAGADILVDVSVKDGMGNTVTGSTASITLDSAVNPGAWPLLSASGLTKAAVNGVASWGGADDLRINKAISGYRLSASGVGGPIVTDAFDITPAGANALRFVQQPTGVPQNVAMSPAVSVEILDEFGNRTLSTATVELTLGEAPCGGNVSGGSAAAVNGVATFDSLSVDTACDGDRLEASSGQLGRATSDAFNVARVNNAGACGVGACGAGMATTVVPVLLLRLGRRRRMRRGRG